MNRGIGSRVSRVAAAVTGVWRTHGRRGGHVLDRDRAYALWAPGYRATAHNPLMLAEERAMCAAIGRIAGATALDVGTGPGRYRRLLTRAGAARVFGVDRSLPMLRAGHPEGVSTGRLVCADARDLPLASASVDIAVSGLMAGDLTSLAGWLREVARVLRPGGRLVYSDFHESWTRRGWRRTFTDRDGTRHVLPLETHTLADHLDALAAAGFGAVRVVDVPVAPPSHDGLRDDGGRGAGNGTCAGERDPRVAPAICTVLAAERIPRDPVAPGAAACCR
jgi:malonyl-CoA O-methyltransferase